MHLISTTIISIYICVYIIFTYNFTMYIYLLNNFTFIFDRVYITILYKRLKADRFSMACLLQHVG